MSQHKSLYTAAASASAASEAAAAAEAAACGNLVVGGCCGSGCHSSGGCVGSSCSRGRPGDDQRGIESGKLLLHAGLARGIGPHTGGPVLLREIARGRKADVLTIQSEPSSASARYTVKTQSAWGNQENVKRESPYQSARDASMAQLPAGSNGIAGTFGVGGTATSTAVTVSVAL